MSWKFFKNLLPWAVLVLVFLWLWPLVSPLVKSLPIHSSTEVSVEEVGRQRKVTIENDKVTLDQAINIAAGEEVYIYVDGAVKVTRAEDQKPVLFSPCGDKARLLARADNGWVFIAAKTLLGAGKCAIYIAPQNQPVNITSFFIRSPYSPFKIEKKGGYLGGRIGGQETGYSAEGILYLNVVTAADRKAAQQKANEELAKKKKELEEASKVAKEKVKQWGQAGKRFAEGWLGDTPKKTWERVPKINIEKGEKLPPMQKK